MPETALIPLPTQLDGERWEWPMTGREAELDALRRELEQAESGRRCVFVSGEPGSGKTRLVSEFAAEAHTGGGTVLFGRAGEDLAKPYLPLVEAFGHCLEHVPPAALAEAPGGLAELSRLVPEAVELLGEPTARKNSPASEQFALFKAGLSLLRLVSQDAPVLLLVEDLHWADRGTLLMLQYLIMGRGDFRGLVVGTFRPQEAAPTGPLARTLTQLGREPEFSRLALSGLSDGETLALLSDLAGHGTGGHDMELARQLRQRANGNPLILTELIRSLLATGTLAEIEGHWRLRENLDSVPLPPRPADSPGASPAGSLEHRGDHWLLRHGDREVTVRDGKGIRYLARLLATPGVEVHAVDLQGGAEGPAAPTRAAAAELSVRGAGSEDAGALLDDTAKLEYRARIEELEVEAEEAESFNDPERAARAREELEFIGRELAAAVGLGGRDRKAASQAERARVNVTRAIRGTLDRIAKHDSQLGGRLKASVRTGTFCCYEPLAGEEFEWKVQSLD